MTDPLDEEVETRYRLAGIVLPAERRSAAINSAKLMLSVQHWLRSGRTAAAEPSNTFSLMSRES